MNVYIVQYCDYEGCQIEAVCENEEKAKEICLELIAQNPSKQREACGYDVDIFEVLK